MSAIAILPCPFCADADPSIDEIDSDVWAVCCDECGCTGPYQSDDGSADVGQKAIDLWNRRPA
jgi:Lar family restriction alleviation protein